MIWSYPCSGSFSTTPSSTSLELEGQLRIVKASVQYLVRVVREVRGEWQQCVPYDITDDRDNLNQEEKTQSRTPLLRRRSVIIGKMAQATFGNTS